MEFESCTDERAASLIRENYEFELDHNVKGAMKIICYSKDANDHSTVR